MPEARLHPAAASDSGAGLRILTVSGVALNLDGQHATVAGRTVPLANREFQVLRLLMENAGRVLTRRDILDQCWGAGYPDQNKTLETHIKRIRSKIEPDRRAAPRIRTVWRVGYIFDLIDPPEPGRGRAA